MLDLIPSVLISIFSSDMTFKMVGSYWESCWWVKIHPNWHWCCEHCSGAASQNVLRSLCKSWPRPDQAIQASWQNREESIGTSCFWPKSNWVQTVVQGESQIRGRGRERGGVGWLFLASGGSRIIWQGGGSVCQLWGSNPSLHVAGFSSKVLTSWLPMSSVGFCCPWGDFFLKF